MRNDEKYYRGCGSVELTNESENERTKSVEYSIGHDASQLDPMWLSSLSVSTQTSPINTLSFSFPKILTWPVAKLKQFIVNGW